ncbi:hypothetical protein [Chryseobacterium sp. JAH]|uniref:hypothetical protein n=1 Tax=Chryseobacterium sp. JAH TaxID=1742858 RepID=UPI000AB8AE91|nr:hypothetical protein [Chryseobacterium sp. JAH]
MNISIILLAIITIVALTYYFLKDIIRVIFKRKNSHLLDKMSLLNPLEPLLSFHQDLQTSQDYYKE